MLVTQDRGVTLIELMIALVISAILVGGTYSIFISQQRSYNLQDQIVGTQQDARAALTIMTKDIRMAGFLIEPEGFNVYGRTDVITPNNSGTGTDSITVVLAAEEFTAGGNPVTVSLVNGQVVTLSAPLNGFFNTGNERFVAFEGKDLVYQVTGTSTDTLTLNFAPSANLASFQARVFRVKAITYSVSGTILQRGDGVTSQTLAGGGSQSQVEDLQIAYQVEGDTANWYNTPPAGKTNADIRAVRINLLERTPMQDSDDQSYQRPALEDRAGSNTRDGFRRRLYTTVVKVRNL